MTSDFNDAPNTIGAPQADGCTCPQPADDRYLLEIDAGGVFVTHVACGKQPTGDWWDDALQLAPVPVQIRAEKDCPGWHKYSCDCDVWAQITIPGLNSQATTPKES